MANQSTTTPATPPGQSLATLTRYKLYARVVGSARDAAIQDVLNAVSAMVCSYCDIDFRSKVRTEIRSGSDSCRASFLTLAHRPITTLTGVALLCRDGSFVDLPFDCYRINPERGTLFGRFPEGYQNIKVSYVGGYAEVPEDVQQAVVLTAKAVFDAGANDATLQAEKIGDYSYSKFVVDGGAALIPPAALTLLAPYRSDPF